MQKTLLIADDHRILRDGLRALLEKDDSSFRIVAEAGDGLEAVQLCRKHRPDVAILDADMPVLNGLDAAAEIQHSIPETQVLILAPGNDESVVIQAIRFGVRGYLLKSASSSEFLKALSIVAQGGSFVSQEISHVLVRCIRNGEAVLDGGVHQLSRRELQVMRLVASGRTSKEIAAILDLGLETVRSYRKTLMRKTGINNIAALTQLAISSGLNPSSGFQERAGRT